MTHTDTQFPELTATQKLGAGILVLLATLAAGTYTVFGTLGLLFLATFPFALLGSMILSWFAVSLLRAAGWTLIGGIIVLIDVTADYPTDWEGHADAWKKNLVHSFTDW